MIVLAFFYCCSNHNVSHRRQNWKNHSIRSTKTYTMENKNLYKNYPIRPGLAGTFGSEDQRAIHCASGPFFFTEQTVFSDFDYINLLCPKSTLNASTARRISAPMRVWCVCHSSASKVALVLHAMCDDNKTCRFLR